METNVNYTVVGAFVIIIVAAITLTIIWLSSGFSFEQYQTYAIQMQESVSGLTLDSPVEFNGVSVGTVKEIDLDQKNPEVVNVLLNIKESTPITQGTYATLTTRGVTGITFISLKDKSTDLRPLVLLPGQKYPVIKTTPSLFLRLDIALNRLSKNIQSVSQSIRLLLNKENQQSIKETLHNLANVTGMLSNNSQKMANILSNTAKASAQLELQTLPTAYNVLSNLEEMSRNMNSITIQIKQNPSVLIRGRAPTAPGPGER